MDKQPSLSCSLDPRSKLLSREYYVELDSYESPYPFPFWEHKRIWPTSTRM